MFSSSEMRIYDQENRRLYINADERERFIQSALKADIQICTFCLTILYTGCRISEALVLTKGAVQVREQLISFKTLKKRGRHSVREVPVPPFLAELLEKEFQLQALYRFSDTGRHDYLWALDHYRHISRSTGYRWVKSVMQSARIYGKQASPKGLRHGYGIHALRSGVRLQMLQKWLGHASMSTTAIYSTAIGKEEREHASLMW